MANGTVAASQIEMLSQSGTGITTIVPPATNTDRTLTLPDNSGTVLTSAGGTLTGALALPSGGLNVGSGQLAVDASGRVTMSAQPYILCKVFRATATIGYYSLDAKSSRNLSVGTYGGASAILAPVAGTYAISFNGISSNTTGRVDMGLRINGLGILASLSEDNGAGFHYRTISSVLNLSAGDAIQLFLGTAVTPYYTSGTGGDLEWGNLSMTLLG